MRTFHKGLGIPAEILLQESGTDFPNDIPGIDWASFPIREMIDKGWIQTDKNIAGNEEEIMRSYIDKAGVCFLTIPHLAKTYLDGAAMILENQLPVIALTLRYTRIDNFWFCLLHELAHLASHLSDKDNEIILDELEPRRMGKRGEDPKEDEADALAQHALVPEDTWNTVDLKL